MYMYIQSAGLQKEDMLICMEGKHTLHSSVYYVHVVTLFIVNVYIHLHCIYDVYTCTSIHVA